MLTEFLVVFVISYIWHALGVTIGYHRLLSHRSFDCPKFVEYFFVMAGYLAFEGSPVWWATMHRAHHRYVDTALDPHSPRFGLYNAHIGWMTKKGYADHISPEKQGKDLLRDPLYRFLEQDGNWSKAHTITFVIAVAFRAILWLCFGWVAALASIVAAFAVLQIPLLLNVVCHLPKLGYRTYAVDDDSVNVWWVGLLAMGEGWHNNHHAFPSSARTGMLLHEFDLSWLTLKALKIFGLVGRLNEAKPNPVAKPAKVRSIDPVSVRRRANAKARKYRKPAKVMDNAR
jgi:stearoyl-CoA desaturase (delta-9 desaturase)